MKPYEYYNYPKPNKRLWWLPLVLVLVLVAVSYIVRGCGADEPEETFATGPSQIPVGPVEQGWHTVLIDGRLYSVLDTEYKGDCTVRMRSLPSTEDPDDFRCQAVLDRAAYEAWCEKWEIEPSFPGHDGNFVVLAGAGRKASRAIAEIAGVTVSGETVTVGLLERFDGEAADSAAYVLTVPVPKTVTELKLEPLWTAGEIEELKRSASPRGE